MVAITAPSREVIEDRMRGLMWTISESGEDVEPTGLYMDIVTGVTALASQSARCHPDDVADLIDGLLETMRATIIERLTDPASDGLADPPPWHQYQVSRS